MYELSFLDLVLIFLSFCHNPLGCENTQWVLSIVEYMLCRDIQNVFVLLLALFTGFVPLIILYTSIQFIIPVVRNLILFLFLIFGELFWTGMLCFHSVHQLITILMFCLNIVSSHCYIQGYVMYSCSEHSKLKISFFKNFLYYLKICLVKLLVFYLWHKYGYT